MSARTVATAAAAVAAAAALRFVLRRLYVIRTNFVTLNDGTAISVREARPGPDSHTLFRFVELLAATSASGTRCTTRSRHSHAILRQENLRR